MTHLQSSLQHEPVDAPDSSPALEVALLTWEYPPIPTAKGRVACETAHALAAHGVNVRVFTMDRDDVVTTDHDRIEVIGCAGRITGLRRLMRAIPGLEHLAAAAAFRERVQDEHERHPFDLIEATNCGAPAAMLMDCGLPIVIRNTAPHAIDAPRSNTMGSRLSAFVARGLEAKCANSAAAVISNSRTHASFIKDWYEFRPGHIHMVTPVSVDPQIARAGASLPYPPAHARLRLGYVGDGSARKGLDELLIAFDIVVHASQAKDEPLPELHVIGLDAADIDNRMAKLGISEIAREQILDFGRLTDESMSHVLARCHGIVAPSRYQSTGSIYREAAAFGRPLVASEEDPAAAEFLRKYACGRLAPSCEPGDLARTILETFSDRAQLVQMRHRGLDAAKSWSRAEFGARTLQVYRRAMNLAPISLPAYQDGQTSKTRITI
ncbi:glycosyltransferase family 4 protein [Henriciella sp. AS95]|uniref:glycosyltransferase family 4 protein n=1 Tax=Henriciella sp. AS95 TaxID=3135782 RepID=UPI00317B786C